MNSMLAAVFLAAFAVANSAVFPPGYITAPLAYSSIPLSSQIVGGAASEDTLIAGPSGTISTSKNVAGPAIATRYAPSLAPIYTARYAVAPPYAYASYGGLYL